MKLPLTVVDTAISKESGESDQLEREKMVIIRRTDKDGVDLSLTVMYILGSTETRKSYQLELKVEEDKDKEIEKPQELRKVNKSKEE